MKKGEIDPNLLLIGGGLALLFFGGRSILQALNVVPDKNDRNDQSQLQTLANSNAFDPDYWKQGGSGTAILKEDAARKLAAIIYNAKGIFNDDEAAVYGVFQALQTKSQVSYLAAKFFQYYQRSLGGYLANFLNTAELAKVAAIVNRLPNYRP